MLKIFEGWFNFFRYYLCPLYYKRVNKLFDERLQICLKCSYIKNRICSQCGCFVDAKVKCFYKLDKNNKSIGGCPKSYW
jgi:hypothetical protein